MANATVLLADNKRSDLRITAVLLRREGYEVVEASTVQVARRHLERGGFDLAILDFHMVDDEDDDDESGLKLAEIYGRSMPVIMLTGRPNVNAVRRTSMRQGRLSVVFEWIWKDEGPEVLLAAMRRAIPPKVFVSHGRDKIATAAVAKFLDDGGVRTVVLREQPGASQPILQKFEKYAEVDFAVILLTPDDVGGLKGDPLRPRARQNVIFELGFFLAKLGRERVVALLKQEEDGEPLEPPSNYLGVQYLDLDLKGGWRIDLAREMAEAGIELKLI